MKTNFARLFANLVSRFGDKEALVNIERNRRYSYREFHALTNRIVNMMRERLQLRRGDIYLCLLENDNMSLLHFWTALKGEAAAAYTNFRDSFDEHCRQAEYIRPKVVFIEAALVDRYYDMLRALGATVVCMDAAPMKRDGLLEFWALLEGVADHDPGVESETQKDILVYRFTGGTTGAGKCAEYTMDNWLACRDTMFMEPDQFQLPDTRMLHMAPISHGSGFGVLATLFRGGCTVTQNLPDLALMCRNIEAERITMTLLLPTLIYRLLEMPEAARYDLSTLCTIAYGGAPMSPARLRLAQERFGNIFVQFYGATESLQSVGILGKADHLTATEKQLGSAGRIQPCVEIMIVDSEGNEVAPGEVGEIWARSRGVISGYYRNPEATAAEFENGFWKSGDLGYIDDGGFVYLVDRKKDMIITGGFNVYAVEVEAALSAHPAVSMSAAVGIPDEEWGEAVHAEVKLKEGESVSAEALIEFVKGKLGRFKGPKSITFVDALPISVVGKVLRRQVRAKYWEGKDRHVS
ncbi:class I adenylate-forming enzyme family protein [Paraburkholderia sartisoli]|uniref:Acyl-CoA synthetase (AMP-forming)/AMP-acid ligase II n=1 Tax=Paraburkholderia sartisoli TaxID=83784 RepID=A0A1H4B1F8_9BURK|nr:AMP-binding protein [Paraburkholderia sartisoli]SEA41970.1 Acyl-CoA synthetase (AMP-forming)/AMP-acid ligase II [Paraburkholderia sartisoli]